MHLVMDSIFLFWPIQYEVRYVSTFLEQNEPVGQNIVSAFRMIFTIFFISLLSSMDFTRLEKKVLNKTYPAGAMNNVKPF